MAFADEKSKERNGFAWFQGDKLYFTPNSKSSPRVPSFQSPDWNPTLKDIQLDYFFTPQWYRGRPYAWLSMVALGTKSCEHGSVFELFKDYNMPTLAEQDEEGLYRIPLACQQRWKAFENNVGAVIGTIYDQISIAQAQIFTIPTPDAMARYTGTYNTEKEALRRAYIARDWFTVYIGALFYACLRCSTYRLMRGGQEIFVTQQELPSVLMTVGPSVDNVEPVKFFPLWFARVASIRRDLVPFLSLLRYTLSNFRSSLCYSGMFIRIQDARELGSLAFFIDHRVPIAYPWGDDEEAYVREHPHHAFYRPPVSLVQGAMATKLRLLSQPSRHMDDEASYGHTGERPLDMDVNMFFEQDTNSTADIPGVHHFHASKSDRPPTPSSFSLEEYSSVKDFYEARDIIIKYKLEQETAEERQERLLKRSSPTRNTPLYLWRENSVGDLIRIQVASRWRTVLDREESGYKLRYDPWNDTADYAKDFDCPIVKSTPIETLGSSDLHRLDQKIREVHRFRIPSIEELEREEANWMDDSALDIASLRFGFVPSPDAQTATQIEADRLYGRIHEALQLCRRSPTLACPADVLPYVANIEEFVNAFRPNQRQEGEIDQCPNRHIWDLHPYPSPSLGTSQFIQGLVRLDASHTMLGQPEDCSWYLVVTNNVDALHACRLQEQGLSLRAVALHFLDRGIPFRAMVPAQQRRRVQDQVPRLTPCLIEVRLEGWSWNKEDYREYCRLRRAVLMRPGVGFAAFQHGGIVWRIAREELGKLPVSTFDSGPDLSGVIEISSDINGWVDNKLADLTVAALCGVYHVPSGTSNP